VFGESFTKHGTGCDKRNYDDATLVPILLQSVDELVTRWAENAVDPLIHSLFPVNHRCSERL